VRRIDALGSVGLHQPKTSDRRAGQPGRNPKLCRANLTRPPGLRLAAPGPAARRHSLPACLSAPSEPRLPPAPDSGWI
jgi:hypothetical protein